MPLFHEDPELGIGWKERLARGRRSKRGRSASIVARRGALIPSGGRGCVCACSSCACVHGASVHLDSSSVSRLFLNRRRAAPVFPAVPASNRTRHACLFLSIPPPHAPPYVSSSLPVTFSGSPGQLLNAAICLRLPPPPPKAPPLVNHGANCCSQRRGTPDRKEK